MAERKTPREGKAMGKVGSDREALKQIGKGDFGVPAGEAGPDRDYVSQNAKASDRGAAQPSSAEFQGNRTHGAGGKASGVGSSSGGDLDTDIIGVGTGGSGIAANTPLEHRPGPDDSDGTSNEMGSGAPAKGENQDGIGKVGGPRPVHRAIAQANRDAAEPVGTGSDAANNPQESGDDSFRGEVSSGDGRGEDENPDGSSEPD